MTLAECEFLILTAVNRQQLMNLDVVSLVQEGKQLPLDVVNQAPEDG